MFNGSLLYHSCFVFVFLAVRLLPWKKDDCNNVHRIFNIPKMTQ